MSAPESVSSRPAPAGRPSASWLASQGRLPLAFMVLALGWLGVAAALMALHPELPAVVHIAPSVVALVHAWVLGFFVTVAVGAIYQLAPVALSTTLWSERLAWWHLGLQALAVPVMVYAFWHWQMELLVTAGTVVLVGVLLFAVNVWITVFRSGKRDPVAWSLALGAGWLLITVAAGITVAANRRWGFWPVDPLPLLRAHAHLGLVGFFVTLLQGVTFRLVPMFTLGDVPDWRPVRIGLWLSQLGLVVLAPALAWHIGFATLLSGGAIVAGLGFSARAFQQTLATRKKRQLDHGLRALVRGGVCLGLSAVAALWLAAPATQAGSAPGGFSANIYGVLLLLGSLLPAIAGMMNKIVPFLTWMRAYGPKVGRAPTPPATALGRPRLEFWGLTLQSAAVVPLLAGTWFQHDTLLTAGAWLLASGTTVFLGNMALILRHLWRPVTVPTPVHSEVKA